VTGYYHVSDGEIDQLLNWGPITFVLAVPFVSFLLTRRDGLQRAMRLAAVLTFTGCAIRIVPCFLLASTRRDHWWARLPLHVGQILNGIAGPVLIAAPSRLSAVWFPPVSVDATLLRMILQCGCVPPLPSAPFFVVSMGAAMGDRCIMLTLPLPLTVVCRRSIMPKQPALASQ
jgi:hypothetical protein